MSLPPLVEPADELTIDEVRRYSRHLIIPDVGMSGQKRLKNARVLVIGAGGLGSPGLLYLAQRTGTRIIPVEVQLSKYWRIGKKWDALWIPKPFSRVTLIYRRPVEIPQETPDLAAEAARLDAAMGPK